jgi:hypothetical protein
MFDGVDTQIDCTTRDAETLYNAVGHLDYELDTLVNYHRIQAHPDDVQKVVRLRQACAELLRQLDKFTDEMSRLKGWYDD